MESTAFEGREIAAFPLSESLGAACAGVADPTGVDNVLPTTTRWKPQKDSTRNIEVYFRGPKGLKPATTLEITDPNGVVLANQNLTFHPATDPEADPADYSITWAGPWTIGSNNPPRYLPRGHYRIVVKGVNADDSTVASDPDDQNATVSLVEVRSIELARCGTLPGVPPCQDGGANLGANLHADGTPMPGGGKAAFPDAPQPDTDYRRTVIAMAVLEPYLGQDASQVTVHFRWIDVDDPSAGRDAGGHPTNDPVDNDLVATPDNRNENAEIVASVAASPELGGAAISHFRVSTQQGNNYRLAASTSEAWLADLCGVVSSTTGEVVHGPCTTSSDGTPLSTDPSNNEVNQVTELLTVWRTLHLELSRFDPSPRTQADLQYNGTWTMLASRNLRDASMPFFSITIDDLLDHTALNGWKGADVNPFSPAGVTFHAQ